MQNFGNLEVLNIISNSPNKNGIKQFSLTLLKYKKAKLNKFYQVTAWQNNQKQFTHLTDLLRSV